jgi:hypothetical protein
LYYSCANENTHFPSDITSSVGTLISGVEEIYDEVSRNQFNEIILLSGYGYRQAPGNP